ncbi:flagellar assembly protein FliH [Buttiauxella warmboldiae]|uniref:Flagellar assembly protein FliH n=1 Tax=Buttiauxella warmboldiae TaxID=82993 RepID=A0A3N5DGC0_9ENTR|nr:flagellar assembly protein FliH [Buttiauxella warmboldiae]RPH26527.1 flagellar assembly protein FliH [Buttiauxella warmboldiae]
MPTSDSANLHNWQVWQPQNLLDDLTPPEHNVVERESAYPSEELLQVELAHLRRQAEEKGFAQGQLRGVEEGKQRGFEAGFAEGKIAGFEQGRHEAGEQQRETGERFSRILEEFKLMLDNLDSVIPSRLVQLSLTAVRSLLGSHITCDHHVLLEKIRQLLHQDRLFKDLAVLWVSPDDMAMVQEHLGTSLTSMGWELRGDATILPGGCRITSEEGEIDATINTRWQELCELSREDCQP